MCLVRDRNNWSSSTWLQEYVDWLYNKIKYCLFNFLKNNMFKINLFLVLLNYFNVLILKIKIYILIYSKIKRI
jgi:hypothetical protein